MTQLEINRIKKVFSEEYKDLGIYRWLNRNIKTLKLFFGISFVAVLSFAILWSSWPLAYWAFAYIGTITIGGIDHLFIGLMLKKILNKLESENINISLDTLLEICSDITPN